MRSLLIFLLLPSNGGDLQKNLRYALLSSEATSVTLSFNWWRWVREMCAEMVPWGSSDPPVVGLEEKK